VICTEACGAGLDLVRTCFNGLVVTTDSAPNLANAMAWLHNRYDLLPRSAGEDKPWPPPFSAQSWAARWSLWFHEFAPPSVT